METKKLKLALADCLQILEVVAEGEQPLMRHHLTSIINSYKPLLKSNMKTNITISAKEINDMLRRRELSQKHLKIGKQSMKKTIYHIEKSKNLSE